MPRLGEIPPEVTLKSGESVELTFDTASDVGIVYGDKGTRYAFPVVLSDGRKAILKGGKRLLNAIQGAIGTASGSIRIKVGAMGNAGSLERAWTVERMP